MKLCVQAISLDLDIALKASNDHNSFEKFSIYFWDLVLDGISGTLKY